MTYFDKIVNSMDLKSYLKSDFTKKEATLLLKAWLTKLQGSQT